MATRKRKAPEESFGDRLRRLRQAKGITQAEIAQRVDISRRAYIYYEAEGGGAAPDLLAKLADALGVSTDVLAGRQNSPAPASTPPNFRLLRRLQKLQELPPHDQKAVLRMIDMMAEARRKTG